MKTYSLILWAVFFGVFQLSAEQEPGSAEKLLEALNSRIGSITAESQELSNHERDRIAQFQSQLQDLSVKITRTEYDHAHNMVAHILTHGLPAILVKEWKDALPGLVAALEKQKEDHLLNWSQEVDQVVQMTREQALKATESKDLDAILMRVAHLQKMRPTQHNIITQRAQKKLEGVAATLENWMMFLDFRAAMNTKAANDTLTRMMNNQGQFPVLTVPEIREQIITDTSEDKMTLTGALRHVFDPIEGPGDVAAARERLKELLIGPNELHALGQEDQHLEILQSAWESFEKGDDEAALGHIKRLQSPGSNQHTDPYLQKIRNDIREKSMTRRFAAATETNRQEEESLSAYFERLIQPAHAAGDFEKVLALMKLYESNDREENNSILQERRIIETFLAAKRFESAGDVPMAISNYRDIVGVPVGRYSPIPQAQESLARLKEQHPKLFEEFNGAIVQQIRELKFFMQQSRRGPGFPY